MRQNNLTAWTYSEQLNCLLFFAQRMDELLFHHTTDTYRYSTLSIRGLVGEYCTVYRNVKSGIINRKNLTHIIEEFTHRLQHDDIAKEILSAEYVDRFIKNYGSWNEKNQYENLRYIGRKLGNKVYYHHIVNRLKFLIAENNQKKEIDEKTALFVRELLDCGYNENYIYQVLHEVFFHRPVSSLSSLDEFFSKFDFAERKFDVYIGYSNDISSLFPLFGKLKVSDLNVSIVDFDSIPKGIKTKRQKTILKFEAIESCDMYSAFEIADALSACVVNSYAFFRHDPFAMRTYGQVIDENQRITTLRPKQLLKYRVSALSHLASTQNAEFLIAILFENYDNLSTFSKITRIHNRAIYSENTSDSLLSLWSILESIVEEDDCNDNSDDTTKAEKKERSKIGNIIAYILPYLKSTYIQKIVQTCMADIIRWNDTFFKDHVANNGFGNNDLEHTFAFLAFDSTKTDREKLYSEIDKYPLLRYRVYTLSEQLHNSKKIKALINNHTQRVKWHLYRIYRARNYIVHDASENEGLNQELVINLHSYVDILFSKVIEIINNSPYEDSISDALTGHKLAVQIMDEKLDKQKDEYITPENALRYFYYDFEK